MEAWASDEIYMVEKLPRKAEKGNVIITGTGNNVVFSQPEIFV